MNKQPKLLFISGGLCSTPLGFGEVFSEQQSLERIDFNDIRKELSPLYGAPLTLANHAHGAVKTRATEALQYGDVFLDAFYHNYKLRKKPMAVAQRTGALTVALQVQTDLSIIEERAYRLANQDPQEWAVSPVEIALNMAEHSQPIYPNENWDYVINIDGNGCWEQVVDKATLALQEKSL